MKKALIAAAVAIAIWAAPLIDPAPVLAQQEEAIERFMGAPAETFSDPAAATDALKANLAADDFDGTAKLLGLDPAELRKAEGVVENFAAIRARAAKLFSVVEDGDQRVIVLGAEVWPFPFPVRKDKDGKWAFDTEAGLEEVINRRIGENELEAIATLRAYVDAQQAYAEEDHDADGVREFAQKLISTEGKTDGLYWPEEQGDGASPAGAHVSEQRVRRAQTTGEGYYGYRARILRGQGDNIAGGRYDYVINDNMIAGFALIAWPVRYAETGVHTFVVSHHGIVYEKDLGPDTEIAVRDIARFNPDKSWTVVND